MPQRPVALITGASGSVGRATAILLARAGYALLLTGRSAEKLDATRDAIEKQTPDAALLCMPADLAAPDVPGRLVQAALDQWGCIDALAHVAGHAPCQPINQNTPELWRQCVDTNLSALVLLTVAAWPTFLQRGRGCVAAVSSMASLDPFPGFSMYAPSKAAVNMFIRCAAAEGDAAGIRAVTIAPGAIETPMLRAIFDEEMFSRDQTLDPMEVAGLLVDCITGKREFENGQTIPQPNR